MGRKHTPFICFFHLCLSFNPMWLVWRNPVRSTPSTFCHFFYAKKLDPAERADKTQSRVAVWLWKSCLISQCPVYLQWWNHQITLLWWNKERDRCIQRSFSNSRIQECSQPCQAWKVRSCFQQHSLFSKDLLVSESLQNVGIHCLSYKAAWAKACWKVITNFLCFIFYILYFLRWHNTLCWLDPALFFRLSRVLCSQDTNFTLSMSFTAYLQTAFLFPLGHMKTLRNGPFILVLQTKRTMQYNQVKHSPVCPLLFSVNSVPYIWPLKTYLLEGLSFSNHKTSHSGHKGYLKTFPQCPCFCCASRTERKE